MWTCCQHLGKPIISIGEDGLSVKAGFETFETDFIELKGKFCQDLLRDRLLQDYMKYCFHREICVKHAPITRIILRSILSEVVRKLFALYLCVVDLNEDLNFESIQMNISDE